MTLTLTISDFPPALAADDVLVGPRADRPRRRSFTGEYKMAVLAEYDGLTEPGAKGGLSAFLCKGLTW